MISSIDRGGLQWRSSELADSGGYKAANHLPGSNRHGRLESAALRSQQVSSCRRCRLIVSRILRSCGAPPLSPSDLAARRSPPPSASLSCRLSRMVTTAGPRRSVWPRCHLLHPVGDRTPAVVASCSTVAGGLVTAADCCLGRLGSPRPWHHPEFARYLPQYRRSLLAWRGSCSVAPPTPPITFPAHERAL